MPIYEFYCARCNTLYSFLSARIDTEKRPDCPKCGLPELERRPARFAALTRSAKTEAGTDDDPLSGIDEGHLEEAMRTLERDLGSMDEENPDPKQLAGALRNLGSLTGLEAGPKMEEMLAKLESGADPESLESAMDTVGGNDESFDDFFRLKKRLGAMKRRPRVDEELYFF